MPQPTSEFRLAQPPHQFKLALADPPKPPVSLSEKYRPRTLDQVIGQGAVVFRVESFLEAPYSTAFLFEGPTGVGKTTIALALAAELGAVEFGGLEIIKSGMQDAEAVETVLRSLHFAPMLGSGWKVVIVDEADYMSPKAAQLWLSALEDLPPKSVVIFTTNKAEKFPDRFLDRCERFAFEANAGNCLQDVQALVDRIWAAEVPGVKTPDARELDLIVNDGQISYRRVVRQLEPLIAEAKRRPIPSTKPAPVAPVRPRSVIHGRDLDSIDWSQVANRYRSGIGLTDLSKDLGVPATSIHGRLRKIGVVFNQRKRGA
jgi:replication-associated recombination protein RarA